MGRQLHFQFDFVIPSVRSWVVYVYAKRVDRKRAMSTMQGKKRVSHWRLNVGKEFHRCQLKWFPREITAIKGLVSYEVKLEDGRVVHRHVEQIKCGTPTDTTSEGERYDNLNHDLYYIMRTL